MFLQIINQGLGNSHGIQSLMDADGLTLAVSNHSLYRAGIRAGQINEPQADPVPHNGMSLAQRLS
jgi:hypothetical protein